MTRIVFSMDVSLDRDTILQVMGSLPLDLAKEVSRRYGALADTRSATIEIPQED